MTQRQAPPQEIMIAPSCGFLGRNLVHWIRQKKPSKEISFVTHDYLEGQEGYQSEKNPENAFPLGRFSHMKYLASSQHILLLAGQRYGQRRFIGIGNPIAHPAFIVSNFLMERKFRGTLFFPSAQEVYPVTTYTKNKKGIVHKETDSPETPKNPDASYEASCLSAESYIREFENHTIFRLAPVIGSNHRGGTLFHHLALALLKGDIPKPEQLLTISRYTATESLFKCMTATLGNKKTRGQTLNFATTKPLTGIEIYQALGEALKEEGFDVTNYKLGFKKLNETTGIVMDISKAKAIFGLGEKNIPLTTLPQLCQTVVADLKAKGNRAQGYLETICAQTLFDPAKQGPHPKPLFTELRK